MKHAASIFMAQNDKNALSRSNLNHTVRGERERDHTNCVEPYQQCNLSQKIYLHNRE
jgi:hypothetical protein